MSVPLLFFDLKTGEPLKEANSCGYANGSYWARGTAWLVFGLSIAYEYTENEKYLDTAIKAAEKYLSSLDNGPIAAAIMTCAFQIIIKYL